MLLARIHAEPLILNGNQAALRWVSPRAAPASPSPSHCVYSGSEGDLAEPPPMWAHWQEPRCQRSPHPLASRSFSTPHHPESEGGMNIVSAWLLTSRTFFLAGLLCCISFWCCVTNEHKPSSHHDRTVSMSQESQASRQAVGQGRVSSGVWGLLPTSRGCRPNPFPCMTEVPGFLSAGPAAAGVPFDGAPIHSALSAFCQAIQGVSDFRPAFLTPCYGPHVPPKLTC